jgi:hypothetical protein
LSSYENYLGGHLEDYEVTTADIASSLAKIDGLQPV